MKTTTPPALHESAYRPISMFNHFIILLLSDRRDVGGKSHRSRNDQSPLHGYIERIGTAARETD